MPDPGEEICDALVEFLRGLQTIGENPLAPEVSLKANIRKTDNPLGELEHEVVELTALLYPSAEAAEKRGRGGECMEEFTISMLVVRKMDDQFTRSRLSQFCRELKKRVRGVRMAGYIWAAEETTQKYDIAMAQNPGTFASVTDFHYLSGGTGAESLPAANIPGYRPPPSGPLGP